MVLTCGTLFPRVTFMNRDTLYFPVAVWYVSPTPLALLLGACCCSCVRRERSRRR